jgi:hypothetical protein
MLISYLMDICKKLTDDYSFGFRHFGITSGFIKAGMNDKISLETAHHIA